MWESTQGPQKLLYPLVNIQKTMENHYVYWEDSLFQWQFSIAMLDYQRVLSTTLWLFNIAMV